MIAEKLKISKSLEPYMGTGAGPLGGIVNKLVGGVMSGGLASLVQNPVGTLTGALQGQLGDMVGGLANIPGADVLQAAIHGDLGGALGALADHTGMMSGLSEIADGGFGPQQILGHASMLASGMETPADMAMDLVLGPLGAGDLVGAIQGGLPGLIDGVVNGGDIGAALDQVRAWTGTVQGLVDGSVGALSSGRAAMIAVSQGASLVSDMIEPPNPYAGAFLGMIGRPDVMDQLAQAKAEAKAQADADAAVAAQRQAEEAEARAAILAAIEAAGIHDPEDEDGED